PPPITTASYMVMKEKPKIRIVDPKAHYQDRYIYKENLCKCKVKEKNMLKKLMIVPVLAALLALSVVSCDLAPTGSTNNIIPFAVYSTDGSRVTLNLEGYGDAEENGRALSLAIAQEGYNFIEVVFEAGDPTKTIARASWERGKAMSITGVLRGSDATPIDYGQTGGANLSSNEGNAAMFVGRKVGNEVTLLAVGKIIQVDGVDGANISASTKSVTFGLAALSGNTVSGSSSFTINGTTNAQVNFGTTAVPLNVTAHSLSDTPVASDTTVTTNYTLATTSTTALPIADALPGIIVVSLNTADPNTWKEGFQPIEPVYLLSNGQERRLINGWNAGKFSGEIKGLTAGTALANPIEIEITVNAGAEGASAFYFSIPVVAVTTANSSSNPPVLAQKWFVRPGIDVAHLDNSTINSSGGSILIISATSALNDIIVDMN
ncbi:MAG: hypothetical protein FWC22_05635, partial [Treponema sp.]|nr:hypothetical protein [Treponema sp.]